MSKELVETWMTEDVVTIAPDMPLPDVHKLMTEEEIRRLPVVDEHGKLVGIVTLGDVREAEPSSATSLSVWELNYLLSKLTVKEIMTKNPITVRNTATLGEAARTMLERRVGGLPVVDEHNKLVGIITESDIFSMVVLHEWREDVMVQGSPLPS
jgi:CBS domain-containing protein